MKDFIKKFIPPIVLALYHRVKNINGQEDLELQKQYDEIVSWHGNFKSWQEAKLNSEGYDNPQILEKVKKAILKVKNGEAIYERDSVVFDKIQYNWPLLSCLFKIASENNNELDILDFGGSLGSAYFQNIHFLKSLKQINWSIVEQKHFVECGKKEIENKELKFYDNIEIVLQERKPKLLFVSSVIQYLDEPYQWVEKFLRYDFDYIIIDRTAFIDDIRDRLTIQHVPEFIYKASYPSWFLNKNKLLNTFSKKYQLITEFDNNITEPYYLDNKKAYWSGFFLKKHE